MEHSIKRKAFSGIFWKILEACGTQGVRLLISIVLARLIDPVNYTVLALMTVFVSLSEVLVQRGFSLALIQRKDAGETDFSSVLWASLGIAAALYAVLFFAAPAIETYYGYPAMTAALRVLALTLPLCALNAVQNAIVARKMEFRKTFLAAFAAAVLSGGVGIGMAYAGFGVWALVAQQLVSMLALCVMLFLLDRWKPRLVIDFSRLKLLLGYGWKLLASALLGTAYESLSQLILGKQYPGDALAFYSKGRQFPSIVGTSLSDAAMGALFPAYAQQQDDPARMLELTRTTIRANAFLFFPIMAGLAAVAETMLPVLLTDKWLPAAPYLRIACILFALYPIESVSLQIINALGRSDLYLKLEIVKKIFGFAAICAAAFLFRTPLAMAWAVTATGVFSWAVVALVMARRYGYRMRDQIADLVPPLALCAVMAAAVLLCARLALPRLVSLIVQIAAGVIVYGALSVICKPQGYRYLLDSFREIRQRRKDSQEG